MPDIANGVVSSGDTAPYFINEMVTYQCNNNYDADGADLTNECMENAGDIVVPAVWSRLTGDLTDTCRAGIPFIDELHNNTSYALDIFVTWPTLMSLQSNKHILLQNLTAIYHKVQVSNLNDIYFAFC